MRFIAYHRYAEVSGKYHLRKGNKRKYHFLKRCFSKREIFLFSIKIKIPKIANLLRYVLVLVDACLITYYFFISFYSLLNRAIEETVEFKLRKCRTTSQCWIVLRAFKDYLKNDFSCSAVEDFSLFRYKTTIFRFSFAMK